VLWRAIFLLYPLSLKTVCDLGLFSKLVCDLGFSRGSKRLKKARKGSEWSASANFDADNSVLLLGKD
jgi:hypothetical protein